MSLAGWLGLVIVNCAALSLAIYGLAEGLHLRSGTDWPKDWRHVVLVTIALSNLATLPPLLMTLGWTAKNFGVSMTLLITIWRLFYMFGVVSYWTATKWLPSEFNSKCLVGCYFAFLILESGLSIKKTTLR